MTKRSIAALTGLFLLTACNTSAPPPTPTPAATATPTARTMHIVLEATVTGDGEARVAYEGDPTDPDGGSEAFRGRWTREFDIGYQDWTAIGKVHVSVTERSGNNATVSCRTMYDDTGSGHGAKTGPLKTAGCHIDYGDSGDEEE